MINETPDKLVLNGTTTKWYLGLTFFAFRTPGGKAYVAQTSDSGENFFLKIGDVDISKPVIQKYPEYVKIPLDHESLSNLIHLIKPDLIKKDMARDEFIFSGRLWKGSPKSYISFWNTKSIVDSHKDLLDKFMKETGISYDNTEFEFPSNQGDYKLYSNVNSKTINQRIMSQLHTLPPGAKKWALKGLRESSVLFENPDTMYHTDDKGDDHELSWTDDNIISVFMSFYLDGGSLITVRTIQDKTGCLDITTDDEVVDMMYNLKDKFKKDWVGVGAITHNDIIGYFGENMDEYEYEIQRSIEELEMAGRMWEIDGEYYMSFWQSTKSIQINKKLVLNLLKKMNINPEEVTYETINGQKYFTYDELFSNQSSAKKSSLKLSKDQLLALMKKQHIDPKAKKILYALGSSKKHVHVLQRIADEMGVPLLKLKQMMVTGD